MTRKWFALVLLPWLAAGDGPKDAEKEAILAERNAIIGKLARGEDFDKNLARFWELKAKFEEAQAANTAFVQLSKKNQQDAKERWARHLKSLDFRVSEECPMAVDPANRPDGGGYHVRKGEYGKIIVKKTVKIPAKTGFDEDETVEVFQVKAQTGTYSFGGREMHSQFHKPFSGQVGDFVFLCYSSASSHGSGSYLPPEFREHVLGSGFVARIKAPPKIVSKASWNPVHLVGLSTLQRAAETGRWTLPPQAKVLGYYVVEKEMGGGRFEIRLDNYHDLSRPSRVTFLLDVPSQLKGSERLGPGEAVWVIMGNPVVDKTLRKLIFTAEDLETVYVEELPDKDGPPKETPKKP